MFIGRIGGSEYTARNRTQALGPPFYTPFWRTICLNNCLEKEKLQLKTQRQQRRTCWSGTTRAHPYTHPKGTGCEKKTIYYLQRQNKNNDHLSSANKTESIYVLYVPPVSRRCFWLVCVCPFCMHGERAQFFIGTPNMSEIRWMMLGKN